jgi:poly(beta-D-mannuronate) C5 epimerase
MIKATEFLQLLLFALFAMVTFMVYVDTVEGSADCLPYKLSTFDDEGCPISFESNRILHEHDTSTIYRIALDKAHTCATYDMVDRVITVTCDSTLSEVEMAINDDKILRKESKDGVWFLNSSLVISRGAIFTINSTDARWLKISSDGRSTGIRGIQFEDEVNQTTPYLIQSFGALSLNGVKISSWDPIANNYTNQRPDGSIQRPYISIETGASPSLIVNSELAYLGYHGVRKQGLNFYGGDGSTLVGNQIHHLWFGFYSDSVSNITIVGNHVYSNSKYGLDPHSGTHDLLIKNNRVHNNGHIGIICSEDCTNIMIENNTVFNNTNAGIMISRNVQDSTIRNNTIRDENTGISVSESSRNTIYHNDISDTSYGIQVKIVSSNNSLHHNSMYNIRKCGIEISQKASDNTINFNTIRKASNYGVCLSSNPIGNIINNNTVDAAQGYAIFVKNSDSPSNVFRYNELLNVARNPIKLANGTLTVADNIIK